MTLKTFIVYAFIAFTPISALALDLVLPTYGASPAITSGSVLISNESQISSVSSASASTGGNSVGKGESVKTGDASASVQVTNSASGRQDSSVHVDITTNVDGVSHTETYDKKLKPGERLDVRIATSSKGTGISGKVSEKIQASSTTSASSTGGVSGGTNAQARIEVTRGFLNVILGRIPHMFDRLVELFHFW